MTAPVKQTHRLQDYEDEAKRAFLEQTEEEVMEASPSGTQRMITLSSFDIMAKARPDVRIFNELLVLYPIAGTDQLQRVTPDNMVVLSTNPIGVITSYNIPLEPASPFVMLEYVSVRHERKDNELNMRRYEQDLRVPYYLLFHFENQELILVRLQLDHYIPVLPDANGRRSIPELDLQVGLLDGWLRFWFRGKLIDLPGELQEKLIALESELATSQQVIASTQQELTTSRKETVTARQAEANARREAESTKLQMAELLRQLEFFRQQTSQTPPTNG